ncbi:hypothetical protein BWD121_002430 [Bartonella sp. WD12.1]|nr:hypothetical protein BWD121_002430 [Bartonella sp. WD12.1]
MLYKLDISLHIAKNIVAYEVEKSRLKLISLCL